MRSPLLLLLAAAFLAAAFLACERERPFEWTPELETVIGPEHDLDAWLSRAPFAEPWRPYADRAEGEMVFTNVEQVFPFRAGFRNDRDDDDGFSLSGEGETYTSDYVIFKDPIWGESFVQATLLYDASEVWLERHYSALGSVLFGGGGIGHSHSATLTPTHLRQGDGTRKAETYWVSSNGRRYLMGFLQRDRLLFQVAFPCESQDTSACLGQLRAVNEALGLDVGLWASATAVPHSVGKTEQLAEDRRARVFWRDPYARFYTRAGQQPVRLKLRDSPLRQLSSDYAEHLGADYAFGYGAAVTRAEEDFLERNDIWVVSGGGGAEPSESPPGYAVLTLSQKPTPAAREQYEDTVSATRTFPMRQTEYPIYVDEGTQGGEAFVTARTYAYSEADDAGSEVVLRGRWASGDTTAARIIGEVVERWRVGY